jgi:hypothetical protein
LNRFEDDVGRNFAQQEVGCAAYSEGVAYGSKERPTRSPNLTRSHYFLLVSERCVLSGDGAETTLGLGDSISLCRTHNNVWEIILSESQFVEAMQV